MKPAAQLITGVSWPMFRTPLRRSQDINFRDLQRPGPPSGKARCDRRQSRGCNRIYSRFGDADRARGHLVSRWCQSSRVIPVVAAHVVIRFSRAEGIVLKLSAWLE